MVRVRAFKYKIENRKDIFFLVKLIVEWREKNLGCLFYSGEKDFEFG